MSASTQKMLDNAIEWLKKQGWTYSAVTDAMISPEGAVIPREKIEAILPHFHGQHVFRSKQEMDAMKQAAQAFGAPSNAPGVTSVWTPITKLKARLDVPPTSNFGLDYCHIFEGPNTTFVFVVKGDKALILDDIKGLFPSDSLVARFRLFQEVE